jgi:hypothetical protein
MENIKIKEVGTRELWEQFSKKPLDVYASAAQRMKDAGIEELPTLTRALEEISPTQKGDTLDAFERMLLEANIRTKSDATAGYWASNAGEFSRNAGTKALLSEFVCRTWRGVSHAMSSQNRAVLLSDDGVVGSFERPYADAMTPRINQQIAPAIPLSELVGMTTSINSDSYRSYFLTYNAEQLRKYRVGESADIPIATLVGSEHTTKLHKYGRGIQASYEDLRRMRVDKMAWYIRLMALQTEIDKVAAALAIIVAGDGNANTAATNYNLTTLDSGTTANNLTVKAWLSFKMKFQQPYVLTTALMNEDIALKVALLNTGSANVPLVAANLGNLGLGVQPINQFADNVRYGWTSEAPANVIVGFDKRFALERVVEIGSEISEMDRYITNQTQILTFTEVEGYASIDGNAAKTLTLSA